MLPVTPGSASPSPGYHSARQLRWLNDSLYQTSNSVETLSEKQELTIAYYLLLRLANFLQPNLHGSV